MAGTTDRELADTNTSNNITLAGYTAKENEDMNVESPRVSPGYFSTMGMPLIAGREFTDQDRDAAHKVAVVNESFARHYFGQPQLAVGHYYCKGAGDVKPDTEIVGVVKDAKHTGVRQEIERTTFTPYLQESNLRAMTFYVRTWQSPESAEATIRRAMQTLDSKLVLDNFRTMEQQIDDILTDERAIATLASTLACSPFSWLRLASTGFWPIRRRNGHAKLESASLWVLPVVRSCVWCWSKCYGWRESALR